MVCLDLLYISRICQCLAKHWQKLFARCSSWYFSEFSWKTLKISITHPALGVIYILKFSYPPLSLNPSFSSSDIHKGWLLRLLLAVSWCLHSIQNREIVSEIKNEICFSYSLVLRCRQWDVTSHSALEVCCLMSCENSPQWKGERAPGPHKREHWGTAEGSGHCQSEKVKQQVASK